jgi:hypothetical protein
MNEEELEDLRLDLLQAVMPGISINVVDGVAYLHDGDSHIYLQLSRMGPLDKSLMDRLAQWSGS